MDTRETRVRPVRHIETPGDTRATQMSNSAYHEDTGETPNRTMKT